MSARALPAQCDEHIAVDSVERTGAESQRVEDVGAALLDGGSREGGVFARACTRHRNAMLAVVVDEVVIS